MSKGKHLLIDCHHVPRDLCLNDELVLDVMSRAAKKAGSTIISQIRYQFGQNSPAGFAAIIMLDESHCSAHSYADLGLMALDVFTCGDSDPVDIWHAIQEELDLYNVSVKEFTRFELPTDGAHTLNTVRNFTVS